MIKDLWPGSILPQQDMGVAGLPYGNPELSAVLAVIVSVLAVTLMFRRLSAAFSGFRDLAGITTRSEVVLGNKYVCDSMIICALVLIPAFAGALCISDISALSFWPTLLVVALVPVARETGYALMGWLFSRRDVFSSLRIINYGSIVPALLAVVLSSVLVWAFPQISEAGYLLFVLIVIAVSLLLYVIRTGILIFSSGFSGFFGILYLCAFEILPVCVAAKILIYGN